MRTLNTTFGQTNVTINQLHLISLLIIGKYIDSFNQFLSIIFYWLTKQAFNKLLKLFLPYRLFKVTIRQDAQSVFADDVIFENSLGPIDFNRDSVYSGFLEGKQYQKVVQDSSIVFNDG